MSRSSLRKPSIVALTEGVIQGDGSKSSKRRSSGYSLAQIESLRNTVDSSSSPFIPKGLTSSVYNEMNPPKDWCDVGLLIPHEAIRRELAAMVENVAAMDKDYDDGTDFWRVLYFAEWFADVFFPAIQG